MKRYYVAPVDNGGSLGPDRKDRTWGVFDRVTGGCVLDADTRTAARRECNERNESAGASTSPLATSPSGCLPQAIQGRRSAHSNGPQHQEEQEP